MKKYIVAFVMMACGFLFADAQTKKKEAAHNKFTTILQTGILEGQADGSYGQLQLVNGIQRNAWFYGLGLGIDYYGSKRSVPLFLDVKWDLKKGKRMPYVYADAGYNISWLRDKDKINFQGGSDYKQKGGVYYEAGIGYKFNLKNKLVFGFSAGYSVKRQKEIGTRFIFIDFPPFPQPDVSQQPEIYDYKFRRISLKFDFWF